MIKHYYIEAGQGDPLILLHGNGENCNYFSKQLDEFSKYFHIYAIDTRGHGKTPKGEKPFTLVQFADDLNEFMIDKGIERANILGFSDGGNIAMLFAIKYPDKVDKLILNGANYQPGGLELHFRVIIEMQYRLLSKKKNPSEKQKHRMDLLRLMINEPVISDEELKSIKSKTLVVSGTRDLIRDRHTKKIAELIPYSKLCFIRGNHSVARMNPKEYNKTVLEFLSN